MSDEIILEKISNRFGRWQFILVFLDMYITACLCPAHFAMPYFAPKLDHWCAPPAHLKRVSSDLWKELSIPQEDGKTSGCEMYDVDYCNVTLENYQQFMAAYANRSLVVKKCHHWDFDAGVWTRTIVQDWNLVCDRTIMISVSSSIYLIGLVFGVISFGQLSDRFGRKKTFLIGLVMWFGAAIGTAFSTSLALFNVFRFMIGFASLGGTTAGFVMFQESLSNKNRSLVGAANMFSYSVAVISLSGLSYVVGDWSYIQMVSAMSLIPAVICMLCVPESPRWLVTSGKLQEALKAIKHVGRINKQALPPDDVIMSELQMLQNNKKSEVSATFFDLFRTRNIRKKTLIIYYLWFVITFSYFSLSLNIQDLGGDLFMSMIVAGFLDIGGFFLVVFCLTKIGRRIPAASSFIVAGACLIVAMLLPADLGWLKTGIALVGRSGTAMLYGIAYVYTAEINPTVVRNVGLGSSSTVGRIGAVLAPYTTNLDEITNPYLSNLIIALLAIIAGFVTLQLPETRNRDLPETLQDGESFVKMDGPKKTTTLPATSL